MQVLAHTEPFVNYILLNKFVCEINPDIENKGNILVINAVAELIKDMWYKDEAY